MGRTAPEKVPPGSARGTSIRKVTTIVYRTRVMYVQGDMRTTYFPFARHPAKAFVRGATRRTRPSILPAQRPGRVPGHNVCTGLTVSIQDIARRQKLKTVVLTQLLVIKQAHILNHLLFGDPVTKINASHIKEEKCKVVQIL
jgi:hypothetical protein